MLHLHRAERADVLVEALGDVLATPLPDPLQAEVVAVPTRGVERWLTQRLAHRLGTSAGRSDGVCANLNFPFPGSLVGEAMGAACGISRENDAWLPERAVWSLLAVLDTHLDESWLATVAGHLGHRAVAASGAAEASAGETKVDELRASRRFATGRHLSDLFDRYSVHRPAMVRAWAAGNDVGAAGLVLPADSAWQAELWRRLRVQIGVDSPAERLERACAALAAGGVALDLPTRISLFGLTRLPASYLDVLRALAAHRDVHLFLLHPSPVLWDRVAATPGATGVRRRADDGTAEIAINPLLRSWGRDAREMQLVLSSGDSPALDHHRPLPGDIAEPASLLRRIQHAVRADIAPPGRPAGADERPLLDADDRSLRVHSCHGRARQVEVVRDAILHALREDPTLEPRDVIVMCPDIETFAPLIHAAFGAGDEDDDDSDETERDSGAAHAPASHRVNLRVRLADRSLRQTNPILSALSALLTLASSRAAATEVLDFAGRDPVRRRFALDDDDLDRLREWVSATEIRWGLDSEHRQPYNLQSVEQNTWQFGLDRVLVGVTMADEDHRLVAGVSPLDDVDSGSIELAGRFAEMVDRLRVAIDSLKGPLTVTEWAAAVAHAGELLFSTTDGDAWQRAQLQRLLDEMTAEATADGVTSDATLSLAELRSLLADRLRGQPTRANFRTGHLTICTMVPMRSVPHRVVCVLGLDDNAFPRKAERDGDDLVAAEPFIGDVDGRSEDRQLLLDALLAATDRLVLTFSGHDERTNAELPPAVPLGELLDVVDNTVRLDPTGERARTAVVVKHPLQPFDPRNFEDGTLGQPKAWSFDHVTLAGAKALRSPRTARPAFLSAPLPPLERTDVIELDHLINFVRHPVRAFLRQRLEVSVRDYADDISDEIPIDLNALQKWGVGDGLLRARLKGAGSASARDVVLARGELPPAALAMTLLDEVEPIVEQLVADGRRVVTGTPDSVEISVELDDGRRVVGTVPGVIDSIVLSLEYSKLQPKHRLPAWVRYLCLTAARPSDGFEVVTLGRSNEYRKTRTQSRFSPVSTIAAAAETWARRHLHEVVDLYDRGLCEPLPLYCATSGAYARALQVGRSVEAALADAHKVWTSGALPFGEDTDDEHQFIFGEIALFDSLLVASTREGEDGEGWFPSEVTRFGRYARRLWAGVLEAETLTHS